MPRRRRKGDNGAAMKRRDFLHKMAATAALAAVPLRAQPARPRIDAARLRQELEALSVFGRPAGGTFADGVSRTAYSDADVAGRQYVMGLMQEVALKPRKHLRAARRPGSFTPPDSLRLPHRFGAAGRQLRR